MATRLEFVPVLLDCGCTVTPRVLNGLEPHTSGGAIVHCPDHAIRHGVTVADVVITVTYTAKRIDPADPEHPATVEEIADAAGVGAGPHVYTVAAVLHGIATAPCTICGAGRNGSLHVTGDDGETVEASE